MKKIKQFLNSLEEKYLFRYGKRSWQLLSVISIGILLYAIILYSWNAIPSFRNEVTISKVEFDKNKIDRDFDESNNLDDCTLEDYKKSLDSLKKEMPKSEWNKLGDSVEVTNYHYVEVYDPYWDYYHTEPVAYTAKEYQKNEDAIPNILEDIFEYKSVDSSQFCERIKILKMIKQLNSFTDKGAATMMLKEYFKNIVIYNEYLELNQIKSIGKLYAKVSGHKPVFKIPYAEKDDWVNFSLYLDICREDSISLERFSITDAAVSNLIKKGTVKEVNIKHEMARKVLGSSLTDEDMAAATDAFFLSPDYTYNDKTFAGIFNKYHRLYQNKVSLAEQLLNQEKWEKERNRSTYLSAGILSFAAILSIATILILFSIRNAINAKKD
jgi:hypothetical protein